MVRVIAQTKLCHYFVRIALVRLKNFEAEVIAVLARIQVAVFLY
jgi:hypothetical protein